MRIGLCPKCMKVKRLTKHHIIPSSVSKKQENALLLFVCRDCHDEIDKITFKKIAISLHELTREDFIQIAKDFLKS